MKLGKGNSLAKEMLTSENRWARPAVAIFFGRTTLAEIQARKCEPQAWEFYSRSLPDERGRTVILVVSDGMVLFLRPAGDVFEYDPPIPDEGKNLWKVMPVDIIVSRPISDVPLILAGINANTYLNRGTFREITHGGNLWGILRVLNWPHPAEWVEKDKGTPEALFRCLASVELETLVAKLFEAAGCFVPAYRGGSIKDIDLFAQNSGATEIVLGSLVIPVGRRCTIQIKGQSWEKPCPTSVDYLICSGNASHVEILDGHWLFESIRRFPQVSGWLKQSLSWLPSEFLANYDF